MTLLCNKQVTDHQSCMIDYQHHDLLALFIGHCQAVNLKQGESLLCVEG